MNLDNRGWPTVGTWNSPLGNLSVFILFSGQLLIKSQFLSNISSICRRVIPLTFYASEILYCRTESNWWVVDCRSDVADLRMLQIRSLIQCRILTIPIVSSNQIGSVRWSNLVHRFLMELNSKPQQDPKELVTIYGSYGFRAQMVTEKIGKLSAGVSSLIRVSSNACPPRPKWETNQKPTTVSRTHGFSVVF